MLHLPESDLKYLYFRIDGPVKPEDVHGLSVERTPAKRQYVTVADTNRVTQKGKEAVATFKVPAHVPVERVELVVGAEPANFSRDVTVKATPLLTGNRTGSGTAAARRASGNYCGCIRREKGTRSTRRIW